MNRWYWFLRVHNRTKKKWKWVLCAYEHNEHSVRVLLSFCDMCHGSGEVEITNEEWLNTLPTEEKARFLVMIEMSVMHPVKRGSIDTKKFIEDVTEWLKQPHKE